MLYLFLKFNFKQALNKLLEKLSGWMDAIILKLPNLLIAIIVMIGFYFAYLKKVSF